jgi:hypothetical protein
MTCPTLIGLLGSVALRLVLDQVDDAAPPVKAQPGLWPRVIKTAVYDDQGNLALEGIDDNDHLWRETVTGRSQEAWLLKQLYIERRFGRRNKKYNLRKKGGK